MITNSFCDRFPGFSVLPLRVGLQLGFVLVSTAPCTAKAPPKTHSVDWLQLSMGLFWRAGSFSCGAGRALGGASRRAAGKHAFVMSCKKLTVNRFMGAIYRGFCHRRAELLFRHDRAGGGIRDCRRDDARAVGWRDHGSEHRQQPSPHSSLLSISRPMPLIPVAVGFLHVLLQQERPAKSTSA